MPKYFTRQEAERVLRDVEPLLREAIHLKAQFQEADEILKGIAREITMRGGMAVNRDQMSETQRQRDSAVSRLQADMEAIQEKGCLVKDLDTGLLDFPTLYDDREVYLCWRLGEKRIDFWHGVDEGFRGRKPIDDEFMAKHKGD
jgi:hypothetical protein